MWREALSFLAGLVGLSRDVVARQERQDTEEAGENRARLREMEAANEARGRMDAVRRSSVDDAARRMRDGKA